MNSAEEALKVVTRLDAQLKALRRPRGVITFEELTNYSRSVADIFDQLSQMAGLVARIVEFEPPSPAVNSLALIFARYDVDQ